MLYKNYRFYLLVALILTNFSALFAGGYVNVRNFPKSLYPGGTQNWAVVQDSLGRLYFGNRDGMLSFDGERWKRYDLPNYTTVRALMFDGKVGRIYAAGSEEFGYFESSESTGELKYKSLLNLLPKKRPKFSEIWKIFKNDNKIWFQSDYQLFCKTDNNTIAVYPTEGRVSTSQLIGPNVYVGLEDGRILTLSNGDFKKLPGAELLSGKRIISILPFGYDGSLLIGTSFDGLFIYDGKTARVYPNPINDFLRANQLFCAAKYDNTYVFGTVNFGAVCIDFTTSRVTYINRETGLQNNTVLNVGFDSAENLWLCLDNGIDYALLSSPTSNLIGHNSSIGAGYASMLVNRRIFFGTNQGLYSADYPYADLPVPPTPQRHLQGQIWSITESPHGMFVASDAGIYVYDGSKFNHIEHIPGTYKVLPVTDNPDCALASTYDGFRLLKWDGTVWHDAGSVGGYDDINGDFLSAPDGSLWLPHWRKGIYRLRFDTQSHKFYDTRLYDTADGFPTNQNNGVSVFDNNIIFITQGGFYKFNEHNDTLIAANNEFNALLSGQPSGDLRTLSDGTLAFINTNGVFLISKRNDGNLDVKHITLDSSNNEMIPGFTHVNYLASNELIVATQDGFTSVRTDATRQRPYLPVLHIGSVYANRDSLVYSARLVPSSQEIVELPFDLNSLRFEFAYPVFDDENIEYSSYLENYEDDWSVFSHEASREYTKLDEGEYTMHVRVRDTHTGQTQTAAFGFSINPPWFRSTLAKIIYYILGILLLVAAYRLAQNRIANVRNQTERRKDKEMQALRKQSEEESEIKDFEIAALKNEQLEQDIQHKSRELSNMTMNIVHLNGVLSDLSSQIANIQSIATAENPRSSVLKPLAKIKDSIEHILSDERDSNAFYKNFDVVYGDYTKRLLERFPNLTQSEKRLCCYIRMGLSSKEIAPLINISYKSVEMARYRLRKKLNLSADTGLTEYLQKF